MKYLITYGLLVIIVIGCGPSTQERKQKRNNDSIASLITELSQVIYGKPIVDAKRYDTISTIHKIIFIKKIYYEPDEEGNVKEDILIDSEMQKIIPDIFRARSLEEAELVCFIDNSKIGVGMSDYKYAVGDPLRPTETSYEVKNGYRIIRYQMREKISIYGAFDGKLIESKIFYGAMPDELPSATDRSKYIYGEDVKESEVLRWLLPLLKNELSNKSSYNNNLPIDYYSGIFTDERDGHVYKWVRIGNQICMAENFAYKPSKGNFWAYNNDEENANTYGYLYDWETAKKIAPKGWHLPTIKEWDLLYRNLGNTDSLVYQKIILGGSSGFNAWLGGSATYYTDYYSDEIDVKFNFISECTYFWSATFKEGGYVWVFRISSDGEAHLGSDFLDISVNSVRLFRD